MPTLYLIDGYAQFFRAFHAIRAPMTSPVTGEPTNMTFGFVGMLLKLLRGAEPRMVEAGGPPDYLAIALDVSGDRETFRSEIFAEYKATRPPPPDGLIPQVERCLALAREVGIRVVGVEGYEADDVMATLVTRLRAQRPDLRIRMISKDKDLKQLLDGPDRSGGGVELYDIHTDAVFDAARLAEETGLAPAQVVDMLALMGDTVDNVPGVPGVGEKTAAQLVAEFGSLDALLARADEVKGKRGERLRESAEVVALARRLVTLVRDAPVELELESAARSALRLDALLPICRELGFNRYQDEVKQLMAGRGATARAAATTRRGATAAEREEAGLFAPLLGESAASAVDGTYHCVRTRKDLASMLRAIEGATLLAVDTETTAIRAMRSRLCGVSLAVRPGEAWYVPVRGPEGDAHLPEAEVLDALRPLLENASLAKCAHNGKYDMLALRRAGVELRGLCAPGGCDTLIASSLVDPGRSSHALDALALAHLGRTNIAISELIGSGAKQRTFDTVPLDRAAEYAAEDADVTLRLYGLLMPRLRAMRLTELFERVELPLVEVLAELEWNGITVDSAELERQRERLAGRIESLARQIADEAMRTIGRPFNPDSPKQLSAALFNPSDADERGLGLRVVKRGKTGASTDIEVLERLAADPEVTTPIPGLIVEYRQLSKLVNTYLVALRDEINPETGRVHASFNQTGAITGRLSSNDPNLQNIPIRTEVGREIRRAFVAPPGHVLVTADYSQIELRLLAHLSRDPALIEAFQRGADIHTAVAAQIAGIEAAAVTREQRDGAKMVNFGIVYGITPYGLARRLGVTTEAAAEIIDGYKRRFAGITTFLQECVEQARRHGYVETMLGRRRPITEIDSNQPQRRALAERIAINSVVQGSAADLIKIAMVDLHGRVTGPSPQLPGVRMLLQIHDELVFEAPESAAEAARRVIVERMEAAMALDVPLRVDSAIARTWLEGK